MKTIIFRLQDETRINILYQFLCEKIIINFPSLKYVSLELDGNTIYAHETNIESWNFLVGVCNGYVFSNGWIEDV